MKNSTVHKYVLLSASIIALSTGCSSTDPGSSAKSLLQGFVEAQSKGDAEHLRRLMYKPESTETFGQKQSFESIANLILQPGKSVAQSQLIELKPTDKRRFEKTHDGVTARLTPTPIGKLEMQFKEKGGTNSIAVMYGKQNGKYYISTYQRVK